MTELKSVVEVTCDFCGAKWTTEEQTIIPEIKTEIILKMEKKENFATIRVIRARRLKGDICSDCIRKIETLLIHGEDYQG